MNKNVAGISVLVLSALAAPWVMYPVFLIKVICFALFASAFNLLIGFAGLLSFGHAAFFGVAGYVAGYVLRSMGGAAVVGAVAGHRSRGVAGLVDW